MSFKSSTKINTLNATKEVFQGSIAATKINRNVRKVIFPQITPIIAEND